MALKDMALGSMYTGRINGRTKTVTWDRAAYFYTEPSRSALAPDLLSSGQSWATCAPTGKVEM